MKQGLTARVTRCRSRSSALTTRSVSSQHQMTRSPSSPPTSTRTRSGRRRSSLRRGSSPATTARRTMPSATCAGSRLTSPSSSRSPSSCTTSVRRAFSLSLLAGWVLMRLPPPPTTRSHELLPEPPSLRQVGRHGPAARPGELVQLDLRRRLQACRRPRWQAHLPVRPHRQLGLQRCAHLLLPCPLAGVSADTPLPCCQTPLRSRSCSTRQARRAT